VKLCCYKILQNALNWRGRVTFQVWWPWNGFVELVCLYLATVSEYNAIWKNDNLHWTTTVVHTTHTIVLLLFWNLSRTTQVSRYQKGQTSKCKTNLDLLEQEIVSGSGICWAICKSAPHPRQPCQHPTTQFFTGRMPFLPPNQQRQSTEGKNNCSKCQLITV